MRILLTGGTGLIGRALCRFWRARGDEVLVWSRQSARVAALCSGAQGIADLAALGKAEHFDAVVNLAGAPIADARWTAARRETLWNSRVLLTRRLVDWMLQLQRPPAVLLSASAVGWWGDAGERVLDESSPAGVPDFGSTLCAAWEAEALRTREAGVRVLLLRIAAVLAAERGMLQRLLPPFRLGLGARLGSGQQWMPWIHIDDVVACADFLLQHADCAGVFAACAPHPVRNAEFTQALARAVRRPALLAVPAWALRLALGEMAVLLLGSQRVQPVRTLQAGYRFQQPELEAALAQLLRR